MAHLVPLQPPPQRDDPVGKVPRQLLEQVHFLWGERGGAVRVDGQGAEGLAVAEERQRDGGAVSAADRLLLPGREPRLAHEVAGLIDAAFTDGGPHGAAPKLVVPPADPDPTQVPQLKARVGNGPDGPVRVILGVAHPGHPVATRLVHDLADGPDELALVVDGHQRLVALREQTEDLVGPQQRGRALGDTGFQLSLSRAKALLLLLALGDIDEQDRELTLRGPVGEHVVVPLQHGGVVLEVGGLSAERHLPVRPHP